MKSLVNEITDNTIRTKSFDFVQYLISRKIISTEVIDWLFSLVIEKLSYKKALENKAIIQSIYSEMVKYAISNISEIDKMENIKKFIF